MTTSLKLTLHLVKVLLFAVNFEYSEPNLQNPNEADETLGAGDTQIWKGVTKQRSATEKDRRNAQSDAFPATPTTNRISDSDLSDLPIPSYVKELYRNLSQHNSKNTEATTIRSLPAIHNEENNGKYDTTNNYAWYHSRHNQDN